MDTRRSWETNAKRTKDNTAWRIDGIWAEVVVDQGLRGLASAGIWARRGLRTTVACGAEGIDGGGDDAEGSVSGGVENQSRRDEYEEGRRLLLT
ncbi:hypothetical protein Droror1_Dr00015505 [Drosera rotundifolia]